MKEMEILPMNYNADDYERILVFGDIHGMFNRLMSLYEKLNVTDRDLLIFLGDYIDRGPENVKTLKWIMCESQKDNVVALCGNHEEMLLTDIVTGNVKINAPNTLGDIARQKKIEPHFDDDVWVFLKSLPLSFEMEIRGQKYFFCHGGVDPDFPLDDQDPVDLLWIREKFWALYDGDAIIVAGHTPLMLMKSDEEIQEVMSEWQSLPENSGKSLAQIIEDMVNNRYDHRRISSSFFADEFMALTTKDCKPQWRRGGKILLMDTGSFFPNGYISCVDLLSGTIWQSD